MEAEAGDEPCELQMRLGGQEGRGRGYLMHPASPTPGMHGSR